MLRNFYWWVYYRDLEVVRFLTVFIGVPIFFVLPPLAAWEPTIENLIPYAIWSFGATILIFFAITIFPKYHLSASYREKFFRLIRVNNGDCE